MLTKTNIQSCLGFSMCEGLQREASSRNPKTVTENRPGRTKQRFQNEWVYRAQNHWRDTRGWLSRVGNRTGMHWEAADREIVHFCMSHWGMLTLCRFYRLQCTLVRSDESRASCTEFGERRRATTQRSIPTVKHSGGSMFWWQFSVWESHRGGRNDEDRRMCDRSGDDCRLLPSKQDTLLTVSIREANTFLWNHFVFACKVK